MTPVSCPARPALRVHFLRFEALRLLELDSKFEELGFTGPQVGLAIGTIVGRACHPASERETHRWLQDQSGLGELIGHNFEESNLYKMYQVSDQLLKKKSAIEEHLYHIIVLRFR